MAYYHTGESIREYVQMAEGYDGRELVDVLKKHLASNSTVLELGMGPGVDMEILGESFRVTGSDNSELFLRRYRNKHPDADLVLLDAVTMDVDKAFDCIYSNKVLMHLTTEELAESLHRQATVLNSRGVLLHSFWYGAQVEEHRGLRFVQYTEESFAQIVGDEYEMVESRRYAEMEEMDSIYFVLRKRQ